ncbi:hypothetical protein [Roseomonas sp. CECT 9278]|uniref:hypothetical protein n=1 Tax=Roseomonas sp. CECT 9278 TaxID=2845823 RepID=UPI001E5F20DB|nr:hypothetical protein [Roseomonas sp. CECT 9278]CAH0270220.1 hypothetical protein ROS9278_03643 [Roseomonas sp. CECT 9278]
MTVLRAAFLLPMILAAMPAAAREPCLGRPPSGPAAELRDIGSVSVPTGPRIDIHLCLVSAERRPLATVSVSFQVYGADGALLGQDGNTVFNLQPVDGAGGPPRHAVLMAAGVGLTRPLAPGEVPRIVRAGCVTQVAGQAVRPCRT